MSNSWEMVIGLEVHAQLKTTSKLFSSSPNQFGSEPNENVNFIDSGMPGMLPVLNFGCIEKAIKTGFALNFTIIKHSVFERKNSSKQNCFMLSSWLVPCHLTEKNSRICWPRSGFEDFL